MSKGASPSSLQIGRWSAGSRAGLAAPPFALGSSLIVCSNPPPNAGFEGRGVVAETAASKTLDDEGTATFAAASGLEQGLDHYEGERIGMFVAQGQMDARLMTRRGQAGQMLGRVAGQGQGRLAGRQVHHPHVAPVDVGPHPGPQGLGAGLLGGEPLGVAPGRIGLAVRAGALQFSEDALLETVAEAVQRRLDAPDVRQVSADADDHDTASSMAARIRRMAASRPTKTASPIRKWPIFSSTISRTARTSLAVAKSRPCPAWTSSPRMSAWAAAAARRSNSTARSAGSVRWQ